ncbi:capsular polysaccharide synthesis protein [Microbaculum marinum]|uniref:Capsular polysaccharide synthesis protein n=1 Tax=Microbaculum marinum TaxID=1764581 RepID=A0AAW9RMJ8_9HYPH
MTQSTDKLIIWQYWENAENRTMPPYLRICSEILRHNCPSCEIRLVTPETLDQYVPDAPALDYIRLRDPSRTPIALKADYLRVRLLHEYGGLWVDVDCIALKDLGPIIQPLISQHDFVALRKDRGDRSFIANNFMASRPGGRVIGEYLETIEAHLAEKSRTDEIFDWTEIGAQMLTPIVDSHADEVHFLPEEDLHPIDFTEAELFESTNLRNDHLDRIGPHCMTVMLYHSLFSQRIKSLPEKFVLQSPTFLGELLRMNLVDHPEFAPRFMAPNGDRSAEARDFTLSDIVIIFTTVARPDSCEAFLASIREKWGPEIRICFAVQGEEEPDCRYRKMAQTHDARVIYVDADAGLSRSRNILVAETEEPVIFLCDDDFLATDFTRLDVALGIFNDNPDISILGGMFYNFYYSDEGEVLSENYTAFNHVFADFPALGPATTVLMPLEYLNSDRQFVSPKYYFQYTDTVNNFCLIDRSVFAVAGIRWDDDIKIMGEHEDFYMSIRAGDNGIKVAYTNAICIDHHRKSTPEFLPHRQRTEGQVKFMRNWDLERLIVPGKRADAIDFDGNLDRQTFPRWRPRLSR